MPKLTFSLDEATVTTLKRLARRSRKPQSLVVREAIARYGEHPHRLSPEETAARLRGFDALMVNIPARPKAETDRELTALRRARRQGGRRTRAE